MILSAAHCYKDEITNSKLYVVLGSVEPLKQGSPAIEKYNRRRMKDNLGERAVCGVGWHHWHWEDHVSQYLHRAGDRRDFDHRCDCDHHVCDHMVMILSQYLHLDG